MWILLGMDHCARSSSVGISSTVTGLPLASHCLRVSVSIDLFIVVPGGRLRLVSPAFSTRGTLFVVEGLRNHACGARTLHHRQTRSTAPGSRRQQCSVSGSP